MPQKIRLRDLDPTLRALISGGAATEGQLNLLLSQYRKKSEVIKEQDIDTVYRNTLYTKINEVKTKLEDHLAQAVVIAAKDLDPALLQRINSLESKMSSIQPGKNYDAEIKALQNNIKELRDIIDALNVAGINRDLASLSASITSAQNEINNIKVLNNDFLNRFSNIESTLQKKRDKDVSITESDLSASVLEKINKGVTALSKTETFINSANIDITNKRDKDVLIGENDLDPGVLNKLNTLVTVNETITNLPATMELELAKKRDKDVPITEVDLDEGISKQLSHIRDIDSTIVNLSASIDNKLGTKRDKSVLIDRNDLSKAVNDELDRIDKLAVQIQTSDLNIEPLLATKRDKNVLIERSDLSKPINDELDKIDSLSLQVNTYKTTMESELANKRDKSETIKKSDLDSEVIDEFSRIDNLSGKIDNVKTDIITLIDDKRDKSVAIKKNDLDSAVTQEIDKIAPLINRFNAFETTTNAALDSKRSKDVLIAESDLNSALQNKLSRGDSAYDLSLNLQSKMNLFPNVSVGDYLTVDNIGGSVRGKKLFNMFFTVERESDLNSLTSNAEAKVVFVRDNCKCYSRSGQSFVVHDNYFALDSMYWHTFIVDKQTKAIVAFVSDNGAVIRFNMRETRRSATLNANASMSFTCGSAMSVPVRVLARESSGKYTPADGVISVLYDANSYTLKNESDENLSIIIIEG